MATEGRYLGGDGDTALALETDGIEGALVGDVGAALAEEPVHEGGLPVVDVGYDGHVADPAGVQRGPGGGGRRRGVRGSGGEEAEGGGGSSAVEGEGRDRG